MLDTHALVATDGSASVGAGPAPTAALATMVYRSRAVQPLSGSDLHRLAQAAQARNRAEAITGLVLYDESRFFQWLEGPRDGLARVMRSIRNDVRHTDIQILNDQPIAARCFGDWNMQLATTAPRAAAWQREVVKPPRQLIADLRRDPDAAAALLVRLAPRPPTRPAGDIAVQGVGKPMDASTVARLEAAILQTVIPQLAAQRGLAGATPTPRPWPLDARASQLAKLLIGPDAAAAVELISQVQGGDRGRDRGGEQSLLRLYPTLFEPAARALGDLFSADRCSEFDVTLGLCRLQTAVRVLGAGTPPQSRLVLSAPEVLLAPLPGEMHGLATVLDAEVLWHAGWAPRCDYPADDRALQRLVADTWFDALAVSLSPALRRRHWLPRLARSIAGARAASRNPAIAVVVSGRVFAEQDHAGDAVGADAAVPTALQVKRAILLALARGRAEPTVHAAAI